MSWFGFASLGVFASLREINPSVRQFSRKGAKPQRKTAKEDTTNSDLPSVSSVVRIDP